MAALLEVDDLVKTYRIRRRQPRTSRFRRGKRVDEEVRAVRGVSFTIERGEAVAYVGPNGAGKSTTIRMMTGITTPTAGTVRVAGLDPARDRKAFARRVGVVFGQRTQLWPDMSVMESYRLLQRIYGVPDAVFDANLAAATSLLQVGKLLDRTSKRLSLGQRVQADITAAFLHDPEIVFLDEPTIALDLEVKDHVRQFIRQRVDRGTTLVLTSHDLGDIEKLCPRIMLIDDGTLMYDGDQRTLLRTYPGERTMLASLEGPVRDADVTALNERAAGFTVRRKDGVGVEITVLRPDMSTMDVLSALSERVRVRDIEARGASIESVLRKLYRRSPEEKQAAMEAR